MNFKLNLFAIACVFLITMLIATKADEFNSGESRPDEITLRNQLFADVILIKEGVDRLLISNEVLKKKFNTQIDTLNTVQTKILLDDNAEEEDGLCDRITGMFNTTFRKYNAFESRLITKLEDIQEEQTLLLGEITSKQDKINRNCGSSKGLSTEGLDELTTFVTEINEKFKTFEQKFEQNSDRLQNLEVKLTEHKTQFNTFVENEMKLLQQISDKLNKNHDMLEKYEKEFPKLNSYTPKPTRKLPMEFILGLTTANVTGLK
ncbi:hypothetical protein DOY81_015352 [Sarcophaga bullata]|nr:hypothetical protein DOY81_015352 [Sarcophaga bullata]